MLFIVSMLVAFNVNAASVTITNANSVVSTGDDIFTENTIPTASAFTTSFNIQSIAGATSVFDIDFTRGLLPALVNLTSYTFNSATYTLGSVSSFSFTSILAAGFNGILTISGLSTLSPTSVNLHVSSVPVPAALFLFAPALLGFFGLRRRATLAA